MQCRLQKRRKKERTSSSCCCCINNLCFRSLSAALTPAAPLGPGGSCCTEIRPLLAYYCIYLIFSNWWSEIYWGLFVLYRRIGFERPSPTNIANRRLRNSAVVFLPTSHRLVVIGGIVVLRTATDPWVGIWRRDERACRSCSGLWLHLYMRMQY